MLFLEKTISFEKQIKKNFYLNSINKSNGIIEFFINGNILFANDNFLNITGYTIDEIKGKHHSLFCQQNYTNTPEYKKFWTDLYNGKPIFDVFEFIHKNGSSIWLETTYTPIIKNNKVEKILAISSDVTEKFNFFNSNNFMVNAINRSLATIEFNLDGTIICANKNFSKTMGYSLDEIKGKHHSMFCEKNISNTLDYQNFWKNLNEGAFHSGKYKRFDKKGNTVWLEATYNPIFNDNCSVIKIIKIAKDITHDVLNVINDEKNASKVYSISKESNRLSSNNKETILQAAHNAQEINQIMIDTEKMMSSLADKVSSINNLVENIKKISQQTHLLSINASIEAANAGEHGKGFSVVAKEVKRLSNMIKESSEQISSNISNIQDFTLKTQNQIKNCSIKSNETANITKNTSDVLTEIEIQLQNLVTTVSHFSNIK